MSIRTRVLVKGLGLRMSLMARISTQEASVGGFKGWYLFKNKSVSRVQGELFNISGKVRVWRSARVNLGIQGSKRSQDVRPSLIKSRAVGTSPQAVIGLERHMPTVAKGGR